MRCLQFDDEKIISGSWDMTVVVGIFKILYLLKPYSYTEGKIIKNK